RTYALGTYLIKLRVTDNDGATDVKTTSLVVADNPPAPALTVTPSSPVAGQPALFDASGSTDSDGTIVRYEWDLDGDGSYETDTGTVPAASRTYPNHGPVTVHLRVTDNDGVTATKALTFTVTDPVAGGGAGGTGTGGGT